MQYSTRHRTSAAAALLAAAILLPATATAGPWVKAPGETYVKVSGSTFESDKAYDVDGNLVDVPYDYSNHEVRAYAEFGVLPTVGMTLSVPYISSVNELNGRTRYKAWGAGDLDLAVQHQLVEGPCAAAASLGLRVPLYEGTVGPSDEPSAVRAGALEQARYTPAIGDGSTDLTPLLAGGCSLHPFPGWVTAEAGPTFRFDGFGDGLVYGVGAGAFVWPERLAVTASASGVQRFASPDGRPTKSYLSVRGGVLVNVWAGFALEAGVGYIPAGAFVARGVSASVGLSFTGEIFDDPFRMAESDGKETPTETVEQETPSTGNGERAAAASNDS